MNTDGDMAPDISLDKQRPAEYVFSRHVENALEQIRESESDDRSGRVTGRFLDGGNDEAFGYCDFRCCIAMRAH